MSDQIHLRFGAQPWTPADTATLVKVYDRHDRPVTGLIEQHGRRYLFDCVEGQVWDVNVWAYGCVTESDVRDLDAAEGTVFAKTVDAIFKAGTVTAAVAVGDKLEIALTVEPETLRRGVYIGIMGAVVDKLEGGKRTAATLRQLQTAAG
ncbi:hypothetical protein [Sphaerisporangium sp. TRM90804]|uniref:hypothetical protein n=1 Tax=Sphaerisporangium sp. TRM90804 TaxID=3031113 RepID=UPI002449E71E|nr:hypothetical protein [Sphaerisporangium sp. TRM90804]MDH2429040.1 hypothetical protein [Sphaerisporangium sp. TRM90804]